MERRILSARRALHNGYDPAPMESALEVVRRKRLILAITTGRSGTEYLARALACFRSVESAHEPKPTFGSAFRTVCAAPETAREFWLAHKLPRIARVRAPVYAETSHLACKGFLESALELGLAMTWIRLARPHREVATSLWRLATIPGRTYGGVKYYLSPLDRGVRLALDPERVERLDDYQLCFWYSLEIEARAAEYEKLARERGVAWHAVELAALREPGGVEQLGAALGLGAPSPAGRVRLAALRGRRVNEKRELKREMALSEAELERLERELRDLLASAEPARRR
jgi:hypothetical protein